MQCAFVLNAMKKAFRKGIFFCFFAVTPPSPTFPSSLFTSPPLLSDILSFGCAHIGCFIGTSVFPLIH